MTDQTEQQYQQEILQILNGSGSALDKANALSKKARSHTSGAIHGSENSIIESYRTVLSGMQESIANAPNAQAETNLTALIAARETLKENDGSTIHWTGNDVVPADIYRAQTEVAKKYLPTIDKREVPEVVAELMRSLQAEKLDPGYAQNLSSKLTDIGKSNLAELRILEMRARSLRTITTKNRHDFAVEYTTIINDSYTGLSSRSRKAFAEGLGIAAQQDVNPRDEIRASVIEGMLGGRDMLTGAPNLHGPEGIVTTHVEGQSLLRYVTPTSWNIPEVKYTDGAPMYSGHGSAPPATGPNSPPPDLSAPAAPNTAPGAPAAGAAPAAPPASSAPPAPHDASHATTPHGGRHGPIRRTIAEGATPPATPAVASTSDHGIFLHMENDFALGVSELSAQQKTEIAQDARMLVDAVKDRPDRIGEITIRGTADDNGGTDAFNQNLANRRGANYRAELMRDIAAEEKKVGLNPARINVIAGDNLIHQAHRTAGYDVDSKPAATSQAAATPSAGTPAAAPAADQTQKQSASNTPRPMMPMPPFTGA